MIKNHPSVYFHHGVKKKSSIIYQCPIKNVALCSYLILCKWLDHLLAGVPQRYLNQCFVVFPRLSDCFLQERLYQWALDTAQIGIVGADVLFLQQAAC